MSNNGLEYGTPVGRLVGGGFALTQDKDNKGNLKFDDKTGEPIKSMYLKIAIPKVLNGSTAHWDAFHALIKQQAAASWPQFFPQGPNGPCSHPRFSFKIDDGDGVDDNGKQNSAKQGWAGHWVITIGSQFVPKAFIEGKFAAHEVLQDPDAVIKLGYYVRVIGQIKSNNADLSANQVPGIKLYPSMVSFVSQGVELEFGINAEEAAGRWALGALPPGSTGAPLDQPGQVQQPATLPSPGALPSPASLPTPGSLPSPAPVNQGPQYSPSAALLAAHPGATIDALLAQGWKIEDLVAQGHAVKNW